ncbi:Bug family tripartite tricarboxylate transporter substrate binding protein [Caldimonas tepidiphila]|uniref:Bug family tripartite tricarboxylate transporter substrate binding protein n=1 Tax=Caldimonas tepidiphila TaxID=2315841 RepID=UPI000E5B105F|nr:tripartite tricarboxylate transporter substrate binding protein [Caldimonas tepidiphila]
METRLMSRRGFATWLAALAGTAVQAQPMATARPLRLVVPYAPGAAADQLARTLERPLTQALAQPIVVDNRAGAGGTLGADMVAKAAPDGLTLVLGNDATHATNLHLARSFPYDPVRHFTPVALVAFNPIVLVVHPSLPVRTVDELLRHVRAHPRELSFGSSGIGTPYHLAGALLNERAGLDLVHVPYKGGAPALTDLLGGNIQVLFASLATVLPHMQRGHVRALATTGSKRLDALPQLPTMAETLPGYALGGWLALFAPAELPTPQQARLNAAVNQVLGREDIRTALLQAGQMPAGGTPQALAELVAAELVQRSRLVKAAGIDAE